MSQPVFFTEIEDEPVKVVTKISIEHEVTAGDSIAVQQTLEELEKYIVEDDLTVDSIQNNISTSILIDDIMEGDEG